MVKSRTKKYKKRGGGLIDTVKGWFSAPSSTSVQAAETEVQEPVLNAKEKLEEHVPEVKPLTTGNPLKGLPDEVLPKEGGRRRKTRKHRRKSRR